MLCSIMSVVHPFLALHFPVFLVVLVLYNCLFRSLLATSELHFAISLLTSSRAGPLVHERVLASTTTVSLFLAVVWKGQIVFPASPRSLLILTMRSMLCRMSQVAGGTSPVPNTPKSILGQKCGASLMMWKRRWAGLAPLHMERVSLEHDSLSLSLSLSLSPPKLSLHWFHQLLPVPYAGENFHGCVTAMYCWNYLQIEFSQPCNT